MLFNHKLKFAAFFYFLCLSFVVSASDSTMLSTEMRVYELFSKINLRQTEQLNRCYNDTITSVVDSMVRYESVLDHSFDSLRNVMSILEAPDGSFRIFNWAYPRKDGTFDYYAYIIRKDKNSSLKVFKLNDLSDSIVDPLKAKLNKKNWYGCLYYELLCNTYNKRDTYTLLGWDGQDLFTNQKIVEVLSFSSTGEPSFGNNSFTGPFSKYKRVMLQYSEKSSMTLNFNKEKQMIVFDHLSPVKPRYTGHYEYYGADFSYDALLFENGKWKYQADIDVRLNKPKKKRKPKK